MSQIKEIYRLHNKGNCIKGIARLCGISKNTVRKYLALLAEQNMSLEAVLTIPAWYTPWVKTPIPYRKITKFE